MIAIFPWSRKTTDGKPSPKNYPHWRGVIGALHARGLETHQVSCSDEADLGCTIRSNDLPLAAIEEILGKSETWVSVDSFVPHMAATLGWSGVVLFGPSDPRIFGHAGNVNLLRDRKYLRTKQFWLWSQHEPDPDAFVPAKQVVEAVLLAVGDPKR